MLHGTLNSHFHKLHESGVGTVVKHAEIISKDEENRLWDSQVMGATLPSTVSGIRLCLLYKSLLYMRMPWECGVCFSPNTNVFSFLSQDGATPLFIASQNGHSETVQLLLSRGANINLPRKVDVLPNIFLYLHWKEAGSTESSPLSTCTGVCCPTPVVDSLYSTPSVSASTGYYIHW